MEIPGFTYDPEKKKYFRIQDSHLSPAGSPYTKEAINDRDFQAQEKQRQDEGKRRYAQEKVKRSDILRHPLLGGLGLERETGRVPLTSRTGQIRRGEMAAELFERRKLIDCSLVRQRSGFNVSTFAMDPLSGRMYVGITSSGAYNLLQDISSFVLEDQPATYDQDPFCEFQLGNGFEWASSFSMAPTGHILVTSHHQEGGAEQWLVAKSPPADDIHCRSKLQYCRALSRSTTWCSAASPNAAPPSFAIGTSDSLSRLIAHEGDWIAEKAERVKYTVSAVEWLTPTVIMAGLKNGTVLFYDTRSGQSTTRLKHPTSVQSISKVDDRRMIVNGIHSTLCMYDLRYTPTPSGRGKASQKYLDFPDYRGTVTGVMDVCPELRLIACGSDNNKIQLFSLATGRPIAPFIPQYVNEPSTLNTSSGSQDSTSQTLKAHHSSLLEVTYPDPITLLRFDDTPRLRLSSGSAIEEWRM